MYGVDFLLVYVLAQSKLKKKANFALLVVFPGR